jgi:hypothetical protein
MSHLKPEESIKNRTTGEGSLNDARDIVIAALN